MDDRIQSIKDTFKEKTWMNLYDAAEKYNDVLLFELKDDKQLKEYLTECEKETLEWIKELTEAIVWKDEWKKYIDKLIEEATQYSIERSFAWFRSKEDKWTLMSQEMFPERILQQSLTEHSLSCFNPLMYFSDYQWKVKCIFRPSRRLLKAYPFISPVFAWTTTKVKYYSVDLAMLRTYNNIGVYIWDIVSINYNIYHPIMWSRIAQKEFAKFRLQW